MIETEDEKSPQSQVSHLDSLYSALASIIKKHSVETIVKNTRMSKSTGYRWVGDYNKNWPSPDLAVSLLEFDSKITNIKDIAAYYGGIIERFLLKTFPQEWELSRKNSSDLPQIENDYEYFIYLICGTGKIISKREIVLKIGEIISIRANLPSHLVTPVQLETLGMVAIENIDSLVAKGILQEKGDGLIRTELNVNIPSSRFTLDNTIELLKRSVKPELWPTGLSTFRCVTTCIEEEDQKAVSQKLATFFNKLDSFIKSKETTSETASPVMLGVFCESMLSTKKTKVIQ